MFEKRSRSLEVLDTTRLEKVLESNKLVAMPGFMLLVEGVRKSCRVWRFERRQRLCRHGARLFKGGNQRFDDLGIYLSTSVSSIYYTWVIIVGTGMADRYQSTQVLKHLN